MILPTRAVGQGYGPGSANACKWQWIFAAEGKLYGKSRMENACYAFTESKSAELRTVWDLFGEAGKDSSSTLSGGWQVWSNTEFAPYLGSWSLLRPTANRGECFWEASAILLSSRKRLHCRGSKTSSSQCKNTS